MAAKKQENNDSAEDQADKKIKGSIKYPPYVNGYGAIPKLFAEICKASVPPKFTQDFMETVLELRSSSHRALIPLLKKLGFIDSSNVPSEAYRNYRDEELRGSVMAERIRQAYRDIYKANEYAHNLKKEELQSKLRALVGAAEDDPVIPVVVATFLELTKLANFDAASPKVKVSSLEQNTKAVKEHDEDSRRRLSHGTVGLSYTINLNLPATTEIDVFNAIFKSLKEHLLDG